MAIEIERKFKVANNDWRKGASGSLLKQGYISHARDGSIRVRIEGSKALLTIKGGAVGASRLEFEYDIPLTDAETMLMILCKKPIIEKIRYRIPFGGHTFEVDEFMGDNLGLIIAEAELKDETELLELPNWIGEEVTGDPKYYNANLIENPFRNWKDES